MGIMVYSLQWGMQDFVQQPYVVHSSDWHMSFLHFLFSFLLWFFISLGLFYRVISFLFLFRCSVVVISCYLVSLPLLLCIFSFCLSFSVFPLLLSFVLSVCFLLCLSFCLCFFRSFFLSFFSSVVIFVQSLCVSFV